MLMNCIPGDVARICKENHTTQAAISRELGVSREAVFRRINGQVVAKGFIEAMELLGYDVRIEYIKREGD